MEGAKYALAVRNGVSAVTTMLSLLKHGDHMLVVDDVYGGT
jgi:cystathionine beta-lyase/cystathionine gamma-synthase